MESVSTKPDKKEFGKPGRNLPMCLVANQQVANVRPFKQSGVDAKCVIGNDHHLVGTCFAYF